jgi:tRNA synthetase class I (W and Y)
VLQLRCEIGFTQHVDAHWLFNASAFGPNMRVEARANGNVLFAAQTVLRMRYAYVELARATARRFNRDFKPIFPEPEALVGRVPRLVGIDGNAKMSKSRGNTIDLKDSSEIVARKVRGMYAALHVVQTNLAQWRKTLFLCTLMHSITTLRMLWT